MRHKILIYTILYNQDIVVPLIQFDFVMLCCYADLVALELSPRTMHLVL